MMRHSVSCAETLLSRTHGVNCGPTCSLPSNSSISTYVAIAGRLVLAAISICPPNSTPPYDRHCLRRPPLADRPTSSSDVRFTSKANIEATQTDVRYWHSSGHSELHCSCPLFGGKADSDARKSTICEVSADAIQPQLSSVVLRGSNGSAGSPAFDALSRCRSTINRGSIRSVPSTFVRSLKISSAMKPRRYCHPSNSLPPSTPRPSLETLHLGS